MAGEYKSITDGIILVSTIIGWNVLIDWLSYISPAVRNLLEPKEVSLVRDGQLLRRNLRRELISEVELMGKLREHGVAELKEVKAAYVERDGGISVIKKKK